MGEKVGESPVDPEAAGADLFAALANQDRLELLSVLLHMGVAAEGSRGMPISRLAAAAEISRFAASRHLAILRRVGLVDMHLEGRRALHHLRTSGFEVLEDWLYPFVVRALVPGEPGPPRTTLPPSSTTE